MAIYNLDSQNRVVSANDKVYSAPVLLQFFVDMVTCNGFEISAKTRENAIYSLSIMKEGRSYNLSFILRNLTHAGWADKPHIKRIQVQNFSKTNGELFDKNEDGHFFFYVGYYNFDNNPLFLFWDPGRYTKHETNRSCYVFMETLQRAREIGYLETINMNRKVWVITKDKFIDFLHNYRSVIN